MNEREICGKMTLENVELRMSAEFQLSVAWTNIPVPATQQE